MAKGRVTGLMGHLRRAAFLRDGAGLSDGQLLECYLSRHDESALEALIRRHGPMVLGVCRRVLGHAHDAEDAFQATFLVLVRKASSVVPPDMVGSWLYGVACQTARKARAAADRRRARERQVTILPEREAPPGPDRDLRALLDQELCGLPDRYRVPIVLCDLEGLTRKEAARHLGWPEGTVSGRLARGRALLARRLAARGVGVAGGAVAAVLAPAAAPAAVSPALVTSTIQAAALFAAGRTVAAAASAKAAVLAEGVLKAMFVTKLKIATAVVLALGVIGLGAGFGSHGTLAADPAGQAAPGSEEKLLREKVARLEKELRQEREEKEKIQIEKERLEKIERLERELRKEREDKARLLYYQNIALAHQALQARDAERNREMLEQSLRAEQARRKELEERFRRPTEDAAMRLLIEKQRQEQKDAEFARRLYLDLWGHLPAAEEVKKFIEDKDAKKRDKLIDKLLDDPDKAKAVRENLRKWLHGHYGQMAGPAERDAGPAKPKP